MSPALSFSGKTTVGEFYDLILRRIKTQTCRQPRKRPIKEGDVLRLYWKQRMPKDRKPVHLIGEARCVSVKRMRYAEFAFDEGFARRDGFGSSLELQDWFGDPLEYADEEYDVIGWQSLTVIKGTKAFKIVRDRYLKLFFDTVEKDLVPRGVFEYGEHKGKYLGYTSRRIEEAKLPMPFGCLALFIQPCTKNGKVTGVIWFCDRVGCLCSPCREDMTKPQEAYPIYCPDPDALAAMHYAEEEEEWEEECSAF